MVLSELWPDKSFDPQGMRWTAALEVNGWERYSTEKLWVSMGNNKTENDKQRVAGHGKSTKRKHAKYLKDINS